MKVLLLFLLTYCCRSHAQDSSTFIIKAGTSFNESVPIAEIYQYSQFVMGKVYFKSGDSTTAKLNHHKFLDQMQFIDLKGDTLNIANAPTIRFIHINNDIFYYDEGWIRQISDINGIKLAIKQTLRILEKNKVGGYGTASPTSAIDSYGVLIDQKGMYNLTPREDVTLTKKTQYYFGNKYNEFFGATRKNLLRQFSKQSRTLDTYLKDNDVDLNKREDLEKLLQFLADL